jgi:hypothetical protein
MVLLEAFIASVPIFTHEVAVAPTIVATAKVKWKYVHVVREITLAQLMLAT